MEGKDVSIWDDKLVPNTPHKVYDGFRSTNMRTACQLIIQDQFFWYKDLLHALFHNDIVDNICKIRIPTLKSDKLILYAKYAYKVILMQVVMLANMDQQNFSWIKFWKAKLFPKILHFIWKCLCNRLRVREII